MAGYCLEVTQCARICLRQRVKASPQTRSFTNTTARRKHGALPTFPSTSSPELDTLLSTWRNNIFMPSHLVRAQQALIYRPTLHKHITGEDPLIVTLPISSSSEATEDFTLVPLNHLRDEPETKAAINQLLQLLKEKKDWAILPSFLEGLKTSGRKVRRPLGQKLIRLAGSQGHVFVVLECLRRADRTNIKLDDFGIAQEAMLSMLNYAMSGEWQQPKLEKAIKYDEDVIFLMQDPKHVVSKGTPPPQDPRKRPELVGIHLALVATRAVKYQDGKDEGEAVEKLAQRILALSNHADLEIGEDWQSANEKLVQWVPAWVGMKLAVRILGEGSSVGARIQAALSADVEPLVMKAKKQVEELGFVGFDGKRRGLALYEHMAKLLE